MSRPRVLLADDHSIVMTGVRSVLEPEFDIVGSVADGRELLAAADELAPDAVVLDISMPALNGIDAARRLRQSHPRLKIVFLTMHFDVAFVKAAFRLGAQGYLVKRTAADELPLALRTVLEGNSYLSPLVTGDAIRDFLASQPSDAAAEAGELTSRQREVLQLICEGRSTKEVAATLNISTKTVLFHKYRVMEQLGLHTVAELTQYAVKHGILTVDR